MPETPRVLAVQNAANGGPGRFGEWLDAGLPAAVPAIENHIDAITALPPGAVWLAETGRCPYQAFRLGERAWGVQFHPEVGPERIRQWDVEHTRRRGLDLDELYAAAVAGDALSRAAWGEAASRFAALVREGRP
ncbi:type 1 glutamine amidotransferase [Microbispora sp. CA-135349]|uniref:type 1 glutamine amidotransferase n=1 Tax=Microbispora sp. CA-135349 TaxID=3239953 RepID=UPI003D94AF74